MYPPDGEDYKFIVIERKIGYEFHKTAEGAVHSFKEREEGLSLLPFKPGTVLLAEIVMSVTFYTDEEGHQVLKRYGRLSRAEDLLGCEIEDYLDGADLSAKLAEKTAAPPKGFFVGIEEKEVEKEVEADAGGSGELAGA